MKKLSYKHTFTYEVQRISAQKKEDCVMIILSNNYVVINYIYKQHIIKYKIIKLTMLTAILIK